MRSSKNKLNSPEELESLIDNLKHELGIKTQTFEYSEKPYRNLKSSHRKTSSLSFENELDFDGQENFQHDLN